MAQFGLRIADCGLRIVDGRSLFRLLAFISDG
jgi:hypothetical protein